MQCIVEISRYCKVCSCNDVSIPRVSPGVPQHWSGHGHEGWPAGAEHQERAGVERV